MTPSTKGYIMLIALRNLVNLACYLYSAIWLMKNAGTLSRKFRAFIDTP